MSCVEKSVFQNVEAGGILTAGISKFAIDLYKRRSNDTNDNLFMSPLSIAAVLSMAYVGARGNTMVEMKKTLSFDDLEDAKLHEAFGDIMKYLRKGKTVSDYYGDDKDPVFQLFMANRLYAEKSYSFLDDFQETCKKYYDAEMAKTDFVGKPLEAANQINSWVSENTNSKIPQVITPDFIDASTRLVLINAIYFKSGWEKTFMEHATQDTDFFISPENPVKVRMMHQVAREASYYQMDELSCQVLGLPYRFRALSMVILLPNKTSNLQELENKLTANHLRSLEGVLKPQPGGVKVWLPKFKLEEHLDLKKVLQDLGMKDLFDMGAADLSGMDGTCELYASKAVHKAFVDVNEMGTEAAGATAMSIEPRCGFSREMVEFRADHPFLFFIWDESTKMILFIGRVKNPQSS